MEIDDISWNETTTKIFNNPLLPKSIRGLIIGKSGCGKTTLLLYLLLKPNWLDYDNLCVFGKSLFQPEYKILKKAFEENLPKDYILGLFKMRDVIQESEIPLSTVAQEWAKTIEGKSTSEFKFFETASDVPDPRELNPVDKILMIFDDLLLGKQNKGLLAGLAARALPMIAKTVLPALGVGALSGLASTGVSKAMGSGLYLKKGGLVNRVEKDGRGLYLSPYKGKGLNSYGDGLYLK